MKPTYSTYLKLEQLLGLQKPLSEPAEHDETLFIVIHQTYELWFNLLLFELDKAKRSLSAGKLFEAVSTFKRCRTVMKTLVGQFDVLETMTPMSFVQFRDRLETSSGFQSAQFRELEFLLGYKRPEFLKSADPKGWGYDRMKRRLLEPSLVDHFYEFLEKRGVKIPKELRAKDPAAPTVPSEAVQEGVLRLYRGSPEAAILFELMMDFDEGMQEWRYRHLKIVERTIGDKPGTGATAGVGYLKTTLFKPYFPDLWAIRHKL